MLVGNGKKPTFAPQFTAEERWVSGWNQQFAKLSYSARGTGGSNPPFSAKRCNDVSASFFVSGYGAVRLAHLLWEQGVEGSNPFAPTVENQGVTKWRNSFFRLQTQNLHAICTHVLKCRWKFDFILVVILSFGRANNLWKNALFWPSKKTQKIAAPFEAAKRNFR